MDRARPDWVSPGGVAGLGDREDAEERRHGYRCEEESHGQAAGSGQQRCGDDRCGGGAKHAGDVVGDTGAGVAVPGREDLGELGAEGPVAEAGDAEGQG